LQASASVEIAKHTLLSGGLILAVGIITNLLARVFLIVKFAPAGSH
jgi:hypothetical protein